MTSDCSFMRDMSCCAAVTSLRPVLTNLHAERRFDFRLIGSGGGHAGILQHAEARIQSYRDAAQAAFGADRIQDRGRRGAVAVIRDQQCVGSAGVFACRKNQFAGEVCVGRGSGSRSMRTTCWRAECVMPARMRVLVTVV